MSFQSLHLMIIILLPFYLVSIIKSITSPIPYAYNSKINNLIILRKLQLLLKLIIPFHI